MAEKPDKVKDVENLLQEQEGSVISAVEEAIAGSNSGGGSEESGDNGSAIALGNDWFSFSRLDNKYTLEEDRPLRELSTEFATAYKAKEKKVLRKADDGDDIYALVMHKNYASRLRAIAKLMGQNVQNFQNIVDAGFITLNRTGTEHIAVILHFAEGISLAELMEREGGMLSEKFVTMTIIPAVNNAIGHLFRLGVLHGRINPYTVFINPKTERITVTECFSEYCGLSQPAFYEPVERASCLPAGKGEADDSADYFALGALIAVLIQGLHIADPKQEVEVLADRLSRGSYSVYVTNNERVSATKELLRGLLQDYAPERWQVNDVYEWLARKKTSAANTARPMKESLTGFEFNNQSYLGRRSLAQAIFRHWASAKVEIKVDELARWLRLNVMRPDLSEELDITFNAAKRKEAYLQDEDLTKLISVIDPDGPIRHIEYSASVYGLPQVLAYGLTKGKREYAQFVADAFNKGLVNQWLELQEPLADYDYNKQYWSGAAIAKYLRLTTLGFGLERVLYDLNPGLCCQSSMLQKFSVYSLSQMLTVLDSLPDDMHEKNDPVDRHIGAFIASKLGLADEIRIKSIRHFPFFAKSPHIIMLALLTLAQTESKVKRLSNLCRWLVKRFGPLVENIQSKTIRKEFQAEIEAAAKSGDLHMLFNVITGPNFIRRDAFGFNEAVKQYQSYTSEIVALKKQSSIERVAYNQGLKIAVMISYFACFATLIGLVMQM